MKRLISAILKGYGSTMILEHRDDVRRFRGFLHPVRSKSKQYLEHEAGELGQYPAGMYVLIGPPEIPAAQGDRLTKGGRHFILRQAEKFCAGDEAVYCWGLCVEEGEELWTESSQM